MSVAPTNAAGRAGMPRYREWRGPAFFRQGFRPFFLGAALGAVVLLAAWVAILQGLLELPTAFGPSRWHGHEMIFGVLAAAVAGFLLTAIPNWTGRMPLQGWPLIGLAALWLAGRAAMAAGAVIGDAAAALVDVTFLGTMLAVVLREIVAGGNWRNLPVALGIGVLAGANALTHLEQLRVIEGDGIGFRLGLAAIACLIALIGGRIIPSFTRNWLVKQGVARTPAPFGRFDAVVLALTVGGLAAWVAVPNHMLTGVALTLAGIGNLVRIARWQGFRTSGEPLVWSLHLGYGWLPIGLFLMGLARLSAAVPETAGLHALTAGAMGGMILAVMTRAALGHTGRELRADRWTAAIYALVFLAAVLRVLVPLVPGGYGWPLILAGTAWCLAFAVFAIRYGAMMVAR